MILPRFPVYVPTKGRYKNPLTIRFLMADGVPFKAVVEPQEEHLYAPVCGPENLLVLPHRDKGLAPTRNWIWEHAKEQGAEWFWMFDDNIDEIRRLWCGERISCDAGPAMRACEDFTLRYENMALTGMNYRTFARPTSPAYRKNVHVYSNQLLRTALPHRFRLLYNDDTDLCLQLLTDGWCTALINVFMIDKRATMSTKGGNWTDETGPINYQGDGRLKMARVLEATWPGIVETKWRFGRPQHVVHWGRFKQEWRLRDDVDPATLTGWNDYGLKLKVVGEIEDPGLRAMVERTAPGAIEAFSMPAPSAPPAPATHNEEVEVTPATRSVPHPRNCACLACEYSAILQEERDRRPHLARVDDDLVPLWEEN